jgi:WD40 repeat protein
MPVDARQIGRIERSVRFMRRRPGTTLAIGGALLLISASITMLISAERRTRHALATSELSQAAIAVQGGDLNEAITRLSLASSLGTLDPLLPGMLARRTDHSMKDLAPRDGGNCTAAVSTCDDRELLIACDGGVRRCSLSGEQTVTTWVYRGRAAAGVIPGPEGSAAWIACRDGTLLQAASAGNAQGWNHFVPVSGVGIQSIAPGPSGTAILGMDDGSVKMVDRSGTQTELARAEPSAKGFGTFVATGPSGQVLAAFPDGRVLLVHTDGTGAARELFRHPVAASSAFWDARNACAAVGYRDGLAVLVYPDRTEQTITSAFNNSIWSMAISPDGQTVAVGDRAGTMHICDANGLRTIRTMHAGTPNPFWWISYESTGESLIALAGDRSVRIPLHPSYPESIRLPAAVRGMINLPHSRLVAWTADGRMYRIDLHAGEARDTGVRFDASRTRALAVGPQTGSVAIIEGNRLLIDGTAPVDGPSIDATGDVRLAWAIDESTLWLLQNGRVTAIQKGKDCSLSSHLGIAPEVPALAALPDARLAISSSQGTWLVQQEHGKLSVTAKPDSGYRCWPVDGGLAFAVPNGSIRWVPQVGGDDRIFTGHTDIVWSCDYEPRRRLLATGGSDRKVRVWDFDTQEQLLALGEHEAPLTCVRWLENGHVLVTADAMGLIHVWTDLPISSAQTATDEADPRAFRGLPTTDNDPIRSR